LFRETDLNARVHYGFAFDDDLYYLTTSGMIKKNEQVIFKGHQSPIVSLINFKNLLYSLDSKGILISSDIFNPIDTKIPDGRLMDFKDDILIVSNDKGKLLHNQAQNAPKVIDTCIHDGELIMLYPENGLNGIPGERIKSNGKNLFMLNGKSLYILNSEREIETTIETINPISHFAANDKYLALVESDSKIKLYCSRSGKAIKVNWSYHSAKVTGLAWSKDDLLISVSLDLSIMIWNPNLSIKPIEIKSRAHSSPIMFLAVDDHDNSLIYTADSIGVIKKWKI